MALSLFGAAGLLYVFLLPLIVLQLFVLILIPSVLQRNGSVRAIGKAVFAYVMQLFGIGLLAIGLLPAVHSVLTRMPYDSNTYIALLAVFAVGGFIFLWHEHMARTVDSGARAVPATIFHFTLKILGCVIGSLSALSLALVILLSERPFEPSFWAWPLLGFLFGLVLCWCTRIDSGHPMPFQSMPAMMGPKLMKGKKR